jgi:glycyl-tRNA synthetase beta chain
MADFLLELLSEEIPARMQEKASADLARLFADEIAKSGLKAEALETYATPRRLALIARNLPLATEAVSEEIKGPRADAPPQAIEGFLKKNGLTRDQLVERTDAKGNAVLFAILDKPGRATAHVLAEAIPAIVRAFPWPKSMRWGSGTLRWVRPLQGIVALLGDDVVEFEIDGIASGSATLGHRFHHPGQITIGNADDYADKLRLCHVILDPTERRRIIAEGAAEQAKAAGLSVIPDDGLLTENAGLTEWPVPLLGSFDPAFLEVPREVIQLTMRTNQKYFACTDGEGRLAPNFICTANISAADGGASIVAGNQKVLAARLSDAKFFWEQDLKIPLEEQAKKLHQIVFHEKLGTVADKVERVAKLARWLVEEGIIKPLPFRGGVGVGQSPQATTTPPAQPHTPTLSPEGEREQLAAFAEQAARLAKADLVTGMVGEFPELQGVMGGYYARAQGLDPQVADAIRDHYKPVGQGDDVPTAPVTVAVSLADKLDTVAGFFYEDMPPTGSKDPFALRRAALGVVSLIQANNIRLDLTRAITLAIAHYGRLAGTEAAKIVNEYLQALEALGVQPSQAEIDETVRAVLGRLLSEDAKKKLILERVRPSVASVLDFFADRLKVQQREAGVRHDLIDAVFALGGEDDLVRLLARVKALQSFVATEDGANLLAGYKRAANIVRIEAKKDGDTAASPPVTPAKAGVHTHDAASSATTEVMDSGLRRNDGGGGYDPLPEEAALIAALDAAEPRAAAAVEAEDFEGAMAALAALRKPIDAFFEKVTVNDPDPARRAARLALLDRIRAAVHTVADFSKIEG